MADGDDERDFWHRRYLQELEEKRARNAMWATIRKGVLQGSSGGVGALLVAATTGLLTWVLDKLHWFGWGK